MRVAWVDYYTEAHTTPLRSQKVRDALEKLGIDTVDTVDADVDLVLCGSVYRAQSTRKQLERWGWSLRNVPVIQYNWDLYPFQLEGPEKDALWRPYLEELKRATEIWVPSECTTVRTKQFTDRNSVVLKPSILPPQIDTPTSRGTYILDAVRKYADPNRNAVKEACEALKIPLMETKNQLSLADFNKALAECRFIVSAQYEASTGGLSLLEAYWLGRPALIADSPRNGGIDYMGDKARYFQWNNPDDLRVTIAQMWEQTPTVNIISARCWIAQEYSPDAMAARMAARFKALV